MPQICELTGKDKSDASRMIGILEEKQMVERILSPGSTYRGKIVLTEKGKEAAQQVKKRAVRAVEIAGKDLTEENRMIFYAALDVVAENLSQLSKDGIPE